MRVHNAEWIFVYLYTSVIIIDQRGQCTRPKQKKPTTIQRPRHHTMRDKCKLSLVNNVAYSYGSAVAAQINWPKNKRKKRPKRRTQTPPAAVTTIKVVHFAYMAIMLKYSVRNATGTGEIFIHPDCEMTCLADKSRSLQKLWILG